MDLCAEHDAGEEGEEKAFKDTKQGEDEGQRTGHEGITVLKVLSYASEEEPGHHPETKHGHRHDVELHSDVQHHKHFVIIFTLTSFCGR